MNYSINSLLGNNFGTFEMKAMCIHGCLCLLYFITKAFLFTRESWTKLVIGQIVNTSSWRRCGDAFTACIRMHFQTINARCRYFAFYAFADGGKFFL